MMVTMLFTVPFGSPALMATVPIVLGALAAVFVARNLRPRVVVGLDGIRLMGVLRPKFVPYSKIQSRGRVESSPQTGSVIVIETADGQLIFPVIGQSNMQIDALIDRIEQGRKRYEEGSARSLHALDRAGRSMSEWMAAVRRLPATGGFRDPALDAGDLERVVADPKAPLERRVGAALALRDPVKVRVAAEQAADPKVRVALEATIDEDEAAIERALKT
jgi:hypothetical protein